MDFDKGPCKEVYQERNELFQEWLEKNNLSNIAALESTNASVKVIFVCNQMNWPPYGFAECSLASMEANEKEIAYQIAAQEAEMAYNAYLEKDSDFAACINNHKKFYK